MKRINFNSIVCTSENAIGIVGENENIYLNNVRGLDMQGNEAPISRI